MQTEGEPAETADAFGVWIGPAPYEIVAAGRSSAAGCRFETAVGCRRRVQSFSFILVVYQMSRPPKVPGPGRSEKK
jgi:hypothetical protein